MSKITAHDSANSKSSGGPHSPQGKSRSSKNALKHGVFASAPLIAGESAREFKQLMDATLLEFRPQGIVEELCAKKIVESLWRQMRADRAECAEIERRRHFLAWDRGKSEAQHAEKSADDISGGLHSHRFNPIVLARCIRLLDELKSEIESRGFRPDADGAILEEVYGFSNGSRLFSDLPRLYKRILLTSQLTEDERRAADMLTPAKCIEEMVRFIARECMRLRKYQGTCDSVTAQRTELEYLGRAVLQGASLDRFVRYGASLDRRLKRYLDLLQQLQTRRREEAGA